MRFITLICFAFTLVSCGTPRYNLPPNSWYASQNYDQLTYWIQYWERVLQDENRKCAYNFPHNHEYHSYVSRHLRVLYIYRQQMELNYRSCWYK